MQMAGDKATEGCAHSGVPAATALHIQARGHTNPHRLFQKQAAGLQQGSRKMKRLVPEHPALDPQGSCKEVMGRRVGNY